jgi:hypothetical protein
MLDPFFLLFKINFQEYRYSRDRSVEITQRTAILVITTTVVYPKQFFFIWLRLSK